jgi:hypothetical protein
MLAPGSSSIATSSAISKTHKRATNGRASQSERMDGGT